jgi:hypothetical protein
MTMLSALLTLALLFGRLIDQIDHAYSLYTGAEKKLPISLALAFGPAAKELT